jgi:hypothetical protein
MADPVQSDEPAQPRQAGSRPVIGDGAQLVQAIGLADHEERRLLDRRRHERTGHGEKGSMAR